MNHFEEKLIEAAKQHFRGFEINDVDNEAQAEMDNLAEVEQEIKRGKVRLVTNLSNQIWQWLQAEEFSGKHSRAFRELEAELRNSGSR